MNNKIAKKIHVYEQLNLKNKLSKQKQRQRNGQGEHFNGCMMGADCGGMGEEVSRLRSTNRSLQNSHGDVRYSIGNGVAKEFIRLTHGHEQQWGDA